MGEDKDKEECKNLWEQFWRSFDNDGSFSQLAAPTYGTSHVCNILAPEGEEAGRSMWQTYKTNLTEAKEIVEDWKQKSERVDSAKSETSKLKTELSTAQQSGASNVAIWLCSNLLLV